MKIVSIDDEGGQLTTATLIEPETAETADEEDES